ncbi:helix-turn-helix domain-containing protein [Streptomyces sp. CT34]|uniref:excisionase family DNA-binding protein n=1 Tax=Streptomyces sp. CT34 TaxID=1553907 RepID=UPI00099B8DEB
MRRPAIPHASIQTPKSAKEVITHTPDPLLSPAEAAEHLGTGVRFIRRLVQERRIRYVKVGRHVRIRTSVLDAYIDDHTVPTLREARSAYRKVA